MVKPVVKPGNKELEMIKERVESLIKMVQRCENQELSSLAKTFTVEEAFLGQTIEQYYLSLLMKVCDLL